MKRKRYSITHDCNKSKNDLEKKLKLSNERLTKKPTHKRGFLF